MQTGYFYYETSLKEANMLLSVIVAQRAARLV